jgi:hypothetical protein
MKTIKKVAYSLPEIHRVQLDKEISLTLDSSMTPIGDPEVMMLNSDPLLVDPVVL